MMMIDVVSKEKNSLSRQEISKMSCGRNKGTVINSVNY